MDEKQKTRLSDKDLEETLLGDIVGQEAVNDDIFKALTGKRKPSVIFTGPTGVGKTAIMKELAKALSGPLGKRDPKKPIIFIDEIHTLDKDQLSKAFDRARDRNNAPDVGEQAAQACHDGLAESMSAMKPLQLKRGFACLM